MDEKKRLVLIDGNAILHRAYHAMPPLTTSDGKLVNAVYGFISILLKIIADFRPKYLGVTFDRPKPTFRKTLFIGYQAKRPKVAEELSGQIELAHEVLRVMGIPIYEIDGFEADDVIGTLVKETNQLSVFSHRSSDKSSSVNQFTSLNRETEKPTSQNQKTENREPITEIIIVTGDRDLLQLVNDGIKVLMPVRGLSQSKLYSEKEVEERMGVKPKQLVDFKALVGDQSDNYPGVKGIGEKTAIELLKKYGTLEEIFAKLDQLAKFDSKTAKKLIEGSGEAQLSKKLATIIADVPISLDIGKCRLPRLDRLDVEEYFQKLEFKSLIPRLSGGIKRRNVKRKEPKEEEQIKLF